jgi:hypothetical protein
MTSLEARLGILSCKQKTDIAISVGAGHCALRATKLVPKNCAAYARISRAITQGTEIQRSSLW